MFNKSDSSPNLGAIENGMSFGTMDSGFSSFSQKNSHRSRGRSGSVGSDGGYGSLNNSFAISSPKSPQKVVNGFLYQDFSSSIVKSKGPILQKCARMQLAPTQFPSSHSNLTYEEREELQNKTRYGRTLIVTGISGSRAEENSLRKRELSFAHVQKQLRHRGVSLRHQFPEIYAELVSHVTDGVHFPSRIIYPVDTKAKKLFMCVLMPEAESEREWTRSVHLLDSLDISKEAISRSLSQSRSLSSSMHALSHVGPADMDSGMYFDSPGRSFNDQEFVLNSENSHERSPKNNSGHGKSSLKKWSSSPNICEDPNFPSPSLNLTPMTYGQSDSITYNDTSLDHFDQCLDLEPHAASSPKLPKSRLPPSMLYSNTGPATSPSHFHPARSRSRQSQSPNPKSRQPHTPRSRTSHSPNTRRRFNTNHPDFHHTTFLSPDRLSSGISRHGHTTTSSQPQPAIDHSHHGHTTTSSQPQPAIDHSHHHADSYHHCPGSCISNHPRSPSREKVKDILQDWSRFSAFYNSPYSESALPPAAAPCLTIGRKPKKKRKNRDKNGINSSSTDCLKGLSLHEEDAYRASLLSDLMNQQNVHNRNRLASDW